MEEMTRRYGEEEAVRLMGEVVKNNEIIMKTQKQLKELLVEVEKKRWQEDRERERRSVKIADDGLYFLFSFYFIFFVFFSFSFSIYRTTQVRVYQSRCHISHKLMA